MIADCKSWEQLNDVPFECFSEPIPFGRSGNEFIFVPYKFPLVNGTDLNNYVEGIYKYKAKEDEWIEWIEYPNDNKFFTTVHTASLDKDNDILYIYNHHQDLITINLLDGTIEMEYGPVFVGSYPSSIFIDDKLHIIGGDGSNAHLIFDTKYNESLKIIHEFEEFGDGLHGHCVIHLKIQNCFLLIVGTCVYKYSLSDDNTQWRLLWTVALKQEIWDFGYIVTNNERYIIVFGGLDNKIFILDTDQMIWRESKIKCPKHYRFHALVTAYLPQSDLLVNGYIKKIYYLPMDIIQMIIMFYECEYVHLFEHFGAGYHWRIPLVDFFL